MHKNEGQAAIAPTPYGRRGLRSVIRNNPARLSGTAAKRITNTMSAAFVALATVVGVRVGLGGPEVSPVSQPRHQGWCPPWSPLLVQSQARRPSPFPSRMSPLDNVRQPRLRRRPQRSKGNHVEPLPRIIIMAANLVTRTNGAHVRTRPRSRFDISPRTLIALMTAGALAVIAPALWLAPRPVPLGYSAHGACYRSARRIRSGAHAHPDVPSTATRAWSWSGSAGSLACSRWLRTFS